MFPRNLCFWNMTLHFVNFVWLEAAIKRLLLVRKRESLNSLNSEVDKLECFWSPVSVAKVYSGIRLRVPFHRFWPNKLSKEQRGEADKQMYSKTWSGPSRVEFVLPFPHTLIVKICFKDMYRVFSWCIGSQGNNPVLSFSPWEARWPHG